MLYVKQIDSFRLGNFINCTPTIKALAELKNRKIPVHFETEYVKQCFLDCPFIEHIGPQDHDPVFTSGMICRENILPDYLYIYHRISREFPLPEMDHTYIDRGLEVENPEKDYVLIMNGTGSQDPNYIFSKDPGIDVMTELIEKLQAQGHKLVFTGSKEDYERAKPWLNNVPAYYNNIRLSLRLISDANFVIANDTGLAHAAGAMNKRLYVLWKNTKFTKNMNPGIFTRYIFKDEWTAYEYN